MSSPSELAVFRAEIRRRILTVCHRDGRIDGMKTMLDLPQSLLNEVELRARREGCQLNDAVIGLLRKGLATPGDPGLSPHRPVFKTHPQSGLPYLECSSDAPARAMNCKDLLALENQSLEREDGQRVGLSA